MSSRSFSRRVRAVALLSQRPRRARLAHAVYVHTAPPTCTNGSRVVLVETESILHSSQRALLDRRSNPLLALASDHHLDNPTYISPATQVAGRLDSRTLSSASRKKVSRSAQDHAFSSSVWILPLTGLVRHTHSLEETPTVTRS